MLLFGIFIFGIILDIQNKHTFLYATRHGLKTFSH